MREPLTFVEARQLVRRILQNGAIGFSRHALDEMRNDNLSEIDIKNVLRGGHVTDCILEKGTWRYRVTTPNMTAVVAFRNEYEVKVVTTWRSKK
jgi:hypothetical protein